MIQIPLSQSGPADQFAKAVEAHRKALVAHMLGGPGEPAPAASPLIEALMRRMPQDGPVATRGPDHIVVADYEIVDDTPLPAEAVEAIKTLRETIQK